MNQNFYNSNSFGYDQSQPPQFPVVHQPPQEMSIQEMKDLKQQYLDEIMSIEINKKEKLQQLEQVANLSTYPLKGFNSFCYDDDNDEDYTIAVTPSLSTEEPDNSLSMGDEHLDTISATESDEFIKSSVENLVPIPSESEGESECDVPAREEFTTFSNILDDQSFSDEDLPKEIYSNPLFEEEIIPMKIDPHHYNAESDLIESLHTHDSSIIISSKIDSLFDEFAGELTLLKLIPPGIDETDCDPEKSYRETVELLSNKFLSLPEIESLHFDIPSFSRPPAKPPDGNTGILNVKMMGGISQQKVPMPRLMNTLAPNQEKSHDLLAHQGLKAF
nr:hypothetical protein [Tanacetum cinerariifolium]